MSALQITTVVIVGIDTAIVLAALLWPARQAPDPAKQNDRAISPHTGRWMAVRSRGPAGDGAPSPGMYP